MEHVEVDGGARLEHRLHFVGDLGGAAGAVGDAPGVEPAVPELYAEGRIVGAVAASDGEGFAGMAAEGEGGGDAFQRAAVEEEVAGAVGGEEGEGDAVAAEEPVERLEIALVGAVGAVFVLDLEGDEGAALVELERGEARQDLRKIVPDGLQVGGVHAAQFDLGAGGEPGWQPAVFPFGADVGAGAHDDAEAQFAGEADEAHEVEVPGEVEVAGPGVVEVPAQVGFHGVEAAARGLFQAVAPSFRGHAEIVDGAGDKLHGLAVDGNAVFREGDAGHRRSGGRLAMAGYAECHTIAMKCPLFLDRRRFMAGCSFFTLALARICHCLRKAGDCLIEDSENGCHGAWRRDSRSRSAAFAASSAAAAAAACSFASFRAAKASSASRFLRSASVFCISICWRRADFFFGFVP